MPVQILSGCLDIHDLRSRQADEDAGTEQDAVQLFLRACRALQNHVRTFLPPSVATWQALNPTQSALIRIRQLQCSHPRWNHLPGSMPDPMAPHVWAPAVLCTIWKPARTWQALNPRESALVRKQQWQCPHPRCTLLPGSMPIRMARSL